MHYVGGENLSELEKIYVKVTIIFDILIFVEN